MSDTKTTPALTPLFGLMSDGTPLDIPIIGFCGGYGSGKTLAGLSLCPEETIEIGVEDSGVTYNLPIKHRFSMYKEVTGKGNTLPKPIDCWEWFRGIVGKIRSGELQCRVLFVDPITDLQAGLIDWVKAHPADFGKSANQYEKASGLLWADVKAHAKMLLGNLSGKCTLVFTAHMGSVWSGGAPVAGKTKAKGIDTFKELSSLYVYLTRDVDPKTGRQPDKPVGHVCPPHGKHRLTHTRINKQTGEMEFIPIVPPRIPEFTWHNLRKYVASPPDYDKLKAGERAEVEHMSDEDKLLLEAETARLRLKEAQIRQELMEKAEAAGRRAGAGSIVKPAGTTAGTTNTATVKAEVKAEVKPEAKQETAKPEPEKTEPPSEKTWDRVSCMKVVLDQIAQLNMTDEQVKQSCVKRNVNTLDELSDEKLEEFRKALWGVLTKREMEQRGKK